MKGHDGLRFTFLHQRISKVFEYPNLRIKLQVRVGFIKPAQCAKSEMIFFDKLRQMC